MLEDEAGTTNVLSLRRAFRHDPSRRSAAACKIYAANWAFFAAPGRPVLDNYKCMKGEFVSSFQARTS